jgi:hypothetical protein
MQQHIKVTPVQAEERGRKDLYKLLVLEIHISLMLHVLPEEEERLAEEEELMSSQI